MTPALAKFLSCFIFSKTGRKRFREKHSALVARYWDLPATQIQELPFDDVESCIARLQEIHNAKKAEPLKGTDA